MPIVSALLYLHGVGGEQGDQWRTSLDQSLTGLSYPGLSELQVIAPKYPNGLMGVDDKLPLPRIVVEVPRGDAARRARHEWERRRTAMEARLGRDDGGAHLPLVDHAVALAANAKAFVQARNYVNDRRIRAWVLQRILNALPPSGRIAIVAHSLGSVIAADLIRRLPANVSVAGVVTIGSPLGHPALHVEQLQELLKEPPANLDWWVNFWSPADPVPAGRGASALFPWILDQRIPAAAGPLHPLDNHAAATYLKSDKVAAAVGYSLFGSQSTAIVRAQKSTDVKLDESESLALLALRRAHLTRMHLEGDTRQRYSEALRHVQAMTIERMIERRRCEKRLVPTAIADLQVDLLDPGSVTPEPRAPSHYDKKSAVIPLVTVAATNLIQPFEIDLPEECHRWAMEQLTLEMGLGRKVGADLLDSMNQARKALQGTNWTRWAAVGVGAVLLAATGGLAAAAAPGLYGAAAIASALAAFGPGGMIGGLLTAGALLSVGSGSVAYGLASSSTSAETVEAHVAAQLAMAILRDKHKLGQDPNTWAGLAAAEMAMNRELSRLVGVSDDSATVVRELNRKLATVRRALDYLEARGLGRRTAELEILAEMPAS